jgi:hypothetical protein
MPAAPALPAGSAAVSDAERTWGVIRSTTSLTVLDDFIRQFGGVPIYGPLARARREELAKEAAKEPAKEPPKPAQQTAAGVIASAQGGSAVRGWAVRSRRTESAGATRRR